MATAGGWRRCRPGDVGRARLHLRRERIVDYQSAYVDLEKPSGGQEEVELRRGLRRVRCGTFSPPGSLLCLVYVLMQARAQVSSLDDAEKGYPERKPVKEEAKQLKERTWSSKVRSFLLFLSHLRWLVHAATSAIVGLGALVHVSAFSLAWLV
uniref:Uncharacterized protein n=1 Tax=Mycena chlorophos TaxID=658473 RepID=A0ABQ0LQQ2_MYCCL|nr:predicted protein [Mycena chlorophos]